MSYSWNRCVKAVLSQPGCITILGRNKGTTCRSAGLSFGPASSRRSSVSVFAEDIRKDHDSLPLAASTSLTCSGTVLPSRIVVHQCNGE